MGLLYPWPPEHGFNLAKDDGQKLHHLDERYPGRGTVIALDLPCVSRPSAPHEPAEATREAPLSGRVLLIDDDAEVLDALGTLLQQWGVTVQVASDLQQDREVAIAPDVVLADYQLRNGETGLMAAHQLRARFFPELPVALITGGTRTETIRTLRLSGFPVVHKPVRPAQLRALLAGMLRGSRTGPG